MPRLKSFARSFAAAEAEDLVQTAVLKAIESRGQFQTGTNLYAWLATIMRNHYLSERRRAWRQQPLDDVAALRIPQAPTQETRITLKQILGGIRNVRYEHRRAFELTVIEEHSMEEAAEIERVPPGTIKSRVNRCRQDLLGDATL